MENTKPPFPILLADDDEDDRIMIQDALADAKIPNPFYWVENGEQLIDYLKHQGQYEGKTKPPMPGLILLDLNMPIKNGHEALKEIKEDEKLRKIPVVILSTSTSKSDINNTYDLGANSFITKPVNFERLVEIVSTVVKYWNETVQLPDR